MKKNIVDKSSSEILRRKAEKLLKLKPSGSVPSIPETDLLELIHELEVHQVELEIQNNELMSANRQAEVAVCKYTELYDFAPTGYFSLSKEGSIVDINFSASQMLGKARSGLKNSQFAFFVSYETKPVLKLFFENLFKSKAKTDCEITLLPYENPPMFVHLIGIYSEENELYQMTAIDITDRKKMEAKKFHTDRLANIGEMAMGMAHEINQPLNIISMLIDKLLFEAARTETIDLDFLKSKSDKIFENIFRIRNIIDDLMAFSRNDFNLVLTYFDINSSIENAALMKTELFINLGINLNLLLEKQIPQICGNTNKFEQVIINLLVNAKDAVMEKKSKHKEYVDMVIGIKSYQDNQYIIVEVTDNGIGISSDDIHNVILPFYTTKEEGKGTGLGLSICYQIIKEMNGTIEITSDHVHGTMIKLALDRQKKKL